MYIQCDAINGNSCKIDTFREAINFLTGYLILKSWKALVRFRVYQKLLFVQHLPKRVVHDL